MAETTVTARAEGLATSAPPDAQGGRGEARWRRRAACRGEGPAVFFPAANPERGRANEQRAKKLCGGCSERVRCLALALEHGEAFGVWGGLNANERLALALAERSATAKQIPLASPAGRAEDGPRSG